jgi:Ca2+-binding EF-hand superfamily protein
MASLSESLQGLGIQASNNNATTTQQQQALRTLINTAKQVSNESNNSNNRRNGGRNRPKFYRESNDEADIFENRLKHVNGHYANQEQKEEAPSKPTRRLRSTIIRQIHDEEEQHRAAAGLRTRYKDRHAVGKNNRISNTSDGVSGLFDSLPLSEKMSVKAPGAVDTTHGVALMDTQSDNHRKWKKQQQILAASRRKVFEKIRATGHETRDIYLKFQRGKSGEVSVDNFVNGLRKIGINLAGNDVEGIADIVDPTNSGIVSFSDFAKAIDGIEAAYSAEKKHETVQRRSSIAKQHKRTDLSKIEKMKVSKLMRNLEQKLSVRFGTGSDRLRRLYMSLDRNGDGTVTKDKLRAGMERVGINLNDNEYKTFLRRIERTGANQPKMHQNDVYYTDLLHAFEPDKESVDIKNVKTKGKKRTGVSTKYLKNWTDLDLSDNSYKKYHEHAQPIDHIEKQKNELNRNADIKFEGSKGRLRPAPLTSEERQLQAMKKLILKKLYERGKSTTKAFLDLDSDRDGIVTKDDLKMGLMSRLGIPLREDQINLLSEHLGRGMKGEGAMIQEFVAAFEDIDGNHGYSNDINGSGGGGEIDGPVAAALGRNAVVEWQGSREHRGQLSRSLTARGTINMGPQYSAGAVNLGATSARKAAVEKAYIETPSRNARRGRALIEKISERLSQKRNDISKLFIEMDTHKHGSLSYNEFRKGLDKAGVHMSDADFKLVAKHIDPVGDGRIEYVEFARTIKGDQRHPDDLTVSPQKTIIHTKDGNPVRVGMCLTNSSRNHSDSVHELMRMPSMEGATPLHERSDKSELVLLKEGHVQETSYEDLSHVATRLKISDTLTSKIGDSLREQYVKLERGSSGILTAQAMHDALAAKGLDIRPSEISVLMKQSGVHIQESNPMNTKLSFDDFKRMTHEAGLGNDSREYDFARAVQLAPGIGHTSGSMKTKKQDRKGTWNVEKHVVKHLTTAAGVEEDKPRKRVTRDKNIESGVGLSLMTPIQLHANQPAESPLIDYNIHNRKYQVLHKFSNPNIYKEHDHIREQKLLGGWEHGVNLNGRRHDVTKDSGNNDRPCNTNITPARKTMLNAPRSSSKILKLRVGPPPSPAVVKQSLMPPPPSAVRRHKFSARQQESQIFQHLQYPNK